jgi:hypothetical protein
MANQFSDWWASQTVGQQGTILSPLPKLEWGVNNRHTKRAYALLALASPSVFTTGNICRMMRLKATDRITGMLINSSGASTVTTVDVELYLPGTALDGALIASTKFATASAVNGGLVQSDILLGTSPTLISRRGMALWEVAGYASLVVAIAAGASEMDLCLTGVGAVTTADEPVAIVLHGSFS